MPEKTIQTMSAKERAWTFIAVVVIIGFVAIRHYKRERLSAIAGATGQTGFAATNNVPAYSTQAHNANAGMMPWVTLANNIDPYDIFAATL